MSLFEDIDGRDTEIIKSNRLNVFVRSNLILHPNGTDIILNKNDKYSFNGVIDSKLDQKSFFCNYIKCKIDDFIHGENQYIFTYGTSSSGKTFTLFGDELRQGIVPRSLWLVFDSFKPCYDSSIKPYFLNDVVVLKPQEKKAINNLRNLLLNENFPINEQDLDLRQTITNPDLEKYSYSIWLSCAEVYNEKVFDSFEALDKRQQKEIRTDPSGSVYIKDLTWIPVYDLKETLKLIKVAKQRQHIAATKLNQQSSRSHSIFSVKLIRRSKLDDKTAKSLKSVRVTSLVFCDMAGSERCSKAQILDNAERLKESVSINSSLLTFGRCIQIMRSNNNSNFDKQTLVPYRDSKLTRLFQSFFNGQGKATMIATISQDSRLFDETLRTIKFAAVAKEVTIESGLLSSECAKVFGIEEEEKRQKVLEKRLINKSKRAVMRKSMKMVCPDTSMMDSVISKDFDVTHDDFDSNYATSDDGSMECPRTPENDKLVAILPTLENEEKINHQKLVRQMKRDHFMELDRIHLEYNKKISKLNREHREEIEYEVTKRKNLQEAVSINNSCALDDSDMSLLEILDKTKKKKCSLCHKIRSKLSVLDRDQRLSLFPQSSWSNSDFERIEESIENLQINSSGTQIIINENDQDQEGRSSKSSNFVLTEKENKCSTPSTIIRNPKYHQSEDLPTVVPIKTSSNNHIAKHDSPTRPNNHDQVLMDDLAEENKRLLSSFEKLKLEMEQVKNRKPKTSEIGIQIDLLSSPTSVKHDDDNNAIDEENKEKKNKSDGKSNEAQMELDSRSSRTKSRRKQEDSTIEINQENQESSDKENSDATSMRATRRTRRINLSLKSEKPERRQLTRRRKATIQ